MLTIQLILLALLIGTFYYLLRKKDNEVERALDCYIGEKDKVRISEWQKTFIKSQLEATELILKKRNEEIEVLRSELEFIKSIEQYKYEKKNNRTRSKRTNEKNGKRI